MAKEVVQSVVCVGSVSMLLSLISDHHIPAFHVHFSHGVSGASVRLHVAAHNALRQRRRCIGNWFVGLVSVLVDMFIKTKTHSLAIGAGYATARSAKGIAVAWVENKTIGMRALLPVVMAGLLKEEFSSTAELCTTGIIGIYGLVVGVVIVQDLSSQTYTSLHA